LSVTALMALMRPHSASTPSARTRRRSQTRV
jgi:hypothetical protein